MSRLSVESPAVRFAVGPLQPTPGETKKAFEPFFKSLGDSLGMPYTLEATTDWAGIAVALTSGQVDVAWMGHYDLTVSMGIPAQFDHPRFLDAMEALLAACKRHHVAAGFLPPTPAATVHWIQKGFRAISLGSDIGVFMEAVRRFRDAVVAGCEQQSGA